MKFLVTGGAGFIGSNFLNKMVRKYPDDQWVCLDALTYAGNMESIEVLDYKNFKFVHENIINRNKIYKLFEKEHFDYVINFAAESHVDRSVTNPGIFVHTNVVGTQVLLDACRKYGIKRYHQVSTDEVYGDLPLEATNEFFKEDSPIKPSSPYSASKASADFLVLAYHRTFGLPVTISRCSNNYGPYQFPEKLIPLMIQRAQNNEPLPVYGKGLNVRDWLYVEDHCDAIDLIVRNGKDGNIYNVGGHNERNNIQVVKAILKALDKPESLIHYVTDRPGHDLRYAIDPSKIEKELGWSPTIKFDNGVKIVTNWYLNNKNWLHNVENGEYLNWMNAHYGKNR
ncbi:MAG: dTDP-glucose 4,6-dehydratase [Bacilli bacterium]|jgi:dTDP-glucose 4,6-dehydratase|nr:dTDP-glucose 4,6-dehydratase [Bacilli bacterium]